MQIAIVHVANGMPLARFEAKDETDAYTQYVASREDLGCDTLSEFQNNYPLLAAMLRAVTVQ